MGGEAAVARIEYVGLHRSAGREPATKSGIVPSCRRLIPQSLRTCRFSREVGARTRPNEIRGTRLAAFFAHQYMAVSLVEARVKDRRVGAGRVAEIPDAL
jgi:hypothetical protein